MCVQTVYEWFTNCNQTTGCFFFMFVYSLQTISKLFENSFETTQVGRCVASNCHNCQHRVRKVVFIEMLSEGQVVCTCASLIYVILNAIYCILIPVIRALMQSDVPQISMETLQTNTLSALGSTGHHNNTTGRLLQTCCWLSESLTLEMTGVRTPSPQHSRPYSRTRHVSAFSV